MGLIPIYRIPTLRRRVAFFCSTVFWEWPPVPVERYGSGAAGAAAGVGEREQFGEGHGFNHPATAGRHDGETRQ